MSTNATNENAACGACMCGAVEFDLTLPVTFCVHCHCTMCQRSHGAGYVTWVAVPRDRMSFRRGESALVRYASSDHGTRSFCGTCGSTLFCESTKRADEVDIVLANVRDPVGLAPQFHAFFDDRASWIDVDDDLPKLGGESGLEPIAGSPD